MPGRSAVDGGDALVLRALDTAGGGTRRPPSTSARISRVADDDHFGVGAVADHRPARTPGREPLHRHGSHRPTAPASGVEQRGGASDRCPAAQRSRRYYRPCPPTVCRRLPLFWSTVDRLTTDAINPTAAAGDPSTAAPVRAARRGEARSTPHSFAR